MTRGPSLQAEPLLNKPSSQEGLKLVERLRDRQRTHAFVQPTHLHSHDYSEGRKLLEEAATLISELQAALQQSVTAIDDWLHVYASEMCDAKRTEEAHERIGACGTLFYIATVQDRNRRALAGLGTDASSGQNLSLRVEPSAEQNYQEATTRHPSFNDAVEAAAKIVDEPLNGIEINRFIADGKVMTDRYGRELFITKENVEHILAAISSAIRSLKLPDYRGGEAKTAESEHSPSTREG